MVNHFLLDVARDTGAFVLLHKTWSGEFFDNVILAYFISHAGVSFLLTVVLHALYHTRGRFLFVSGISWCLAIVKKRRSVY